MKQGKQLLFTGAVFLPLCKTHKKPLEAVCFQRFLLFWRKMQDELADFAGRFIENCKICGVNLQKQGGLRNLESKNILEKVVKNVLKKQK